MWPRAVELNDEALGRGLPVRAGTLGPRPARPVCAGVAEDHAHAVGLEERGDLGCDLAQHGVEVAAVGEHPRDVLQPVELGHAPSQGSCRGQALS